jgi:hypothetical protein
MVLSHYEGENLSLLISVFKWPAQANYWTQNEYHRGEGTGDTVPFPNSVLAHVSVVSVEHGSPALHISNALSFNAWICLYAFMNGFKILAWYTKFPLCVFCDLNYFISSSDPQIFTLTISLFMNVHACWTIFIWFSGISAVFYFIETYLYFNI